MPGSHALLSPSAAHRWLHCTAAPRLEEHEPDGGSDFTREGTLAHAFCAKKLREHLGQSTHAEDAEIAELSGQYLSGEMPEYVDEYVTTVLAKFTEARKVTPDAELLVETRLSFEKYMPAAFGTADAIIIADGTMEVVDFKYGKGVRVEATDNPQMMIYALGAYDMFSFDYDIRLIRMTIVQPRIDNLSEFEIKAGDLLRWADSELKPKAAEAYGGKGVQVPGDWCRFCKVRGKCRALARDVLTTVADHAASPDPDTGKIMAPEVIAREVLPNLDRVRAWLKAVEDYTLDQALTGTHYEGYKLVEGRSVRKFTDQEAVIRTLEAAGYEKKAVVRPTEPKTITELEKLVGKKQLAALLGDLIEKPSGKPTLVPESDRRKPINQAADDFANIAE